LYSAGNVLFVTENEGATWDQISPDLTTNDKSKQLSSGGPITKDNTSVEYYCTIFTATESHLEKDLLWTGSDDGIISVSRDGGRNWQNVTPAGAPKWIMWNCVEVDPFKKGAAYFVGTRYKLDDYTPYIYKTEDYGKSWKLITNGIDAMHFTRAMRADHKRPGLLYAGTEFGMYISFNDGASWKPFQQNLPIVPITDLTIKENDLIVATQGRSFYVIDRLDVVQQLDQNIINRSLHVFKPDTAYRVTGSSFASFGGTQRNAGTNPPEGVVFRYYAKNVGDSTKGSISIYDRDHKLVKTFTTDAKEANAKFELVKGMNEFNWNLLYPESERIEGMVLWNGVPGGIVAPPGQYYAKFKIEKDSAEVPFVVKPVPNYRTTNAEYHQQFEFLKTVQDKFNETQKAVKDIRALRSQINAFTALQGKELPKEVKSMADSINKMMTQVEETLYQTKAKSSQDVLNYPIRLNDKLSGIFDVANSGNFPPSRQARDVYNALAADIDVQLAKLNSIKQKDIPALNELIRQKSLPVIGIR
jgi:hypothetical protein